MLKLNPDSMATPFDRNFCPNVAAMHSRTQDVGAYRFSPVGEDCVYTPCTDCCRFFIPTGIGPTQGDATGRQVLTATCGHLWKVSR